MGANNAPGTYNLTTQNGQQGYDIGGFWPVIPASDVTKNASNGPNLQTQTGGSASSIPSLTQSYSLNPSFALPNGMSFSGTGGSLSLNRENIGGGTTGTTYALDPTGQYYIPSAQQGGGQPSWWQTTGIPLAAAAAMTMPPTMT